MTDTKIQTMPIESNTSSAITPMGLLNRALESGATTEQLKELLDLQERWEATQARKAFNAAMSAAKAELPIITKNRTVDFTSAKGRTNYDYEDFAGIAEVVDPILAEHGLSYRFRTETADNKTIVTCIIMHRDGHTEENSLPGLPDNTGNKNAIQAVGSTITYLQRYTLKAALGLASSDDTDASNETSPQNVPISDDQVKELKGIADKAGADMIKFCKYFKVAQLSDLAVFQFKNAKAMLERKLAQ